ncbi:MAG: hypothetical protein LBF93_12160 [Zoogloeaceae bacterium]|jgi:hypothetical protein|nr:hypothetical protein [Zoogloeaceae bacterium]
MTKKLIALVFSLVLVVFAAVSMASYIVRHPRSFTGDAEELLAGVEDVLGGGGESCGSRRRRSNWQSRTP